MSVRTQNLAKDTRYGLFFPLSSHMQLTRALTQDWIHILTDPDPPEMARLLRVGQFVTWPKVRNVPKHHRSYYSLVLSCT
jgi:hypothetical protein